MVFLEPETVVEHVADKALLGIDAGSKMFVRRNGPERVPIFGVTVTAHALQIDACRRGRAGAEFATHVSGEGERHLVEKLFRLIVILDLDAVVGVDASPVWNVKVVVSQAVIIGNDVHPWSRRPLDLPAQTFPRVG
jgi:hypothetical protein